MALRKRSFESSASRSCVEAAGFFSLVSLASLLGCGDATVNDAAFQTQRGAVITRTDDIDCPPSIPCDNVPAGYAVTNPMTGSYGNYDLADRPRDGQTIRYIVIHTTEGSYSGTLAVFQDPTYSASAHYVVRSRDGHLAKMVSPDHVAWHAGNWYWNAHSVGIEHEAVSAEGPRWFTDELYATSATLVRYLADRYNIPLDREHIIGHDEVPGLSISRTPAMHWDPGPYWDWNRFMRMVRGHSAEFPGDRPDDGDEIMGPVRIAPDYATNHPSTSYCFPGTPVACREVPGIPSSFIYLRQAPSDTAPLIVNSYLSGTPGDRMNNWGNKAGAGRIFYRVDRVGDWDAIDYSGQVAWFYNPGRKSTRIPRLRGDQAIITPKSASVAIYGGGYPGDGAYTPPKTPVHMDKVYDLPRGQRYVADGPITADYYWARVWAATLPMSTHQVIKDSTLYYVLSWNHRLALVRASDVDVLRATSGGGGGYDRREISAPAHPDVAPPAGAEDARMPLRDLKGMDESN